MSSFWRSFLSDESGQALPEYSFIIALVAVVVIAALLFLSGQIEAVFQAIRDTFDNDGADAT